MGRTVDSMHQTAVMRTIVVSMMVWMARTVETMDQTAVMQTIVVSMGLTGTVETARRFDRVRRGELGILWRS